MNFQSKNDQEGSYNVVINSIKRIKSSIILCIVIVDTQYFFPNSRYLLLYLENCRYLLTHCFIFSRFFRFPGTLRVPPSIPTSILGKIQYFEQSIMLKDSYERSLRAEFFWFLYKLIFFQLQRSKK